MSAAPPAASRPSRRTASTSDRPAAVAASSTAAASASASASVAATAAAPAGSTAGSKRAAEAEADAPDDAAERSNEKEQAAAGARKRVRKGDAAVVVGASVNLLLEAAAAAPLATAASAAASTSANADSPAAASASATAASSVSASAAPAAVSAASSASAFAPSSAVSSAATFASASAAASTAISSAASASASVSASASASATTSAAIAPSASASPASAASPMPAALAKLSDADAAAVAQRITAAQATAAAADDDAAMVDADVTEGRAIAAASTLPSAAAAAASSAASPPAATMVTGFVVLGGKYTGPVVAWMPHGRGTMHRHDGGVLTGEFREGKMEGAGVYRTALGHVYEGQFHASKRSGQGAQWDANGVLTECGQWKFDRFVADQTKAAVPMRLLSEGRFLNAAAQQAKREHPDDSALLPDGSFYLGELNAQGQPDGLGSIFNSDGSPRIALLVDAVPAKSGRWVKGKLQGRAILHFPHGNRYEGACKDGLAVGIGAYFWKSGRRYEGEWLSDKHSGLGAFWNEDGKLSKCGRWKAGRFVEECAVPLRCISDDKLSAAALQAKRDHPTDSALLADRSLHAPHELLGTHYVGPLNKRGQPHGPAGQGASFNTDGSPRVTLVAHESDASQSGRWVDGKLYGRATRSLPSGRRDDGLFQSGQLHGLGERTMPDGVRYEGEFVEDKRSGQGVEWGRGGEIVTCGQWKHDQLVTAAAVPLQCLPQKRFLSPHAKTASLLFPDGGYYVGPINARNQRDGEGSMYTSGGGLIVSGRWLNDRPVQPAPLPAALASSAAFASSFAAAVAAAAASPPSSALPAVAAAAAAAAPTAAASSLSSVSHTPVAAAASAAASAAALASSSSASAAPAAASSASAPAISAAAFPALGFPLSSPLLSSASSLSLAGFTGLYEGERNDACQRHGLGVQWGADGVIARCGRWAEDKYVGKSAVPLKHLQGALLSVSALRAKLDHPDGSLVRLDLRRFYVGQVNYRHVPHGQGSSFYPDGLPEIVLAVDDADPSLSGRWVKGMLHGRATQMLSNGICYSGLFKDSGFEGLGVYVWPTGERFEGEFAAGKFNGFGAQWSGQGTLSKCGRWVDDVCVDECAVALDRVPEGQSLSAAAAQCKSAHPNGSLVRLDETGRFYIGAINERGQPHGQGQTFYPSGAPQYTPTVDPTARLSGRWVDGLLQGRATRMLVRGDRYDGLFQDDCCEGLGVYVGSAGWRYEGEFAASTRAGQGAQWDSQGKLIKCGRWEDSKLVASCAVPLSLLPDKRWLSAHAKTASLLFPDGGYYVGPISARNQRHGDAGQMFSASGDLLLSGAWSNDQLQSSAASSIPAAAPASSPSTSRVASVHQPAAASAAAASSVSPLASASAIATSPRFAVPIRPANTSGPSAAAASAAAAVPNDSPMDDVAASAASAAASAAAASAAAAAPFASGPTPPVALSSAHSLRIPPLLVAPASSSRAAALLLATGSSTTAAVAASARAPIAAAATAATLPLKGRRSQSARAKELQPQQP